MAVREALPPAPKSDEERQRWAEQLTVHLKRQNKIRGISVLDYGATGNGVTDDTAAFNLAIAAANKLKPVYVPAGNYVISNIVLQGTTGNNAPNWGLIGDGKDVTKITGKAAGTGAVIQAASDTDTVTGYRSLLLSGFSVLGNATYTCGIQLGSVAGATDKRVLGVLKNITASGFTKTGGAGIIIVSSTSLRMEDVYCQANYDGLHIGTATDEGVDEITESSFIHCQFRNNANDGVAMFHAQGGSWLSCVLESNTRYGLYTPMHDSFITSNHIFMACWWEANKYHIYAKAATSGSRTYPTHMSFYNCTNGVVTDATDYIYLDSGRAWVFVNSAGVSGRALNLANSAVSAFNMNSEAVTKSGTGSYQHLSTIGADMLRVLNGKLLSTDGLGAGNSVANTNTPSGATARALEVFDAAGASLGFIPVYGSAW